MLFTHPHPWPPPHSPSPIEVHLTGASGSANWWPPLVAALIAAGVLLWNSRRQRLADATAATLQRAEEAKVLERQHRGESVADLARAMVSQMGPAPVETIDEKKRRRWGACQTAAGAAVIFGAREMAPHPDVAEWVLKGGELLQTTANRYKKATTLVDIGKINVDADLICARVLDELTAWLRDDDDSRFETLTLP